MTSTRARRRSATFTKRVNVYLEKITKARLQRLAEEVGIEDSAMARQLIEEGLDRRGVKAALEAEGAA